MPAYRPAIERFEDLYAPEPNSGCWLWLGCVDRCGYGKFSGGDGETLAHRFAYSALVGPIPHGHEIDHQCKVRGCVNPAHLRAVTHAENVRRADYTSNHRNGRKTHCKRGHPLAGDNLLVEVWRGTTARKCRACRLMNQRRRKGGVRVVEAPA